MKSTGIVRRIDELGRVVIPIELRNKFKIAVKDPVEIYADATSIILKKYEQNCLFCSNSKNLIEYKDKLICSSCLESICELKNEENNKAENVSTNQETHEEEKKKKE